MRYLIFLFVITSCTSSRIISENVVFSNEKVIVAFKPSMTSQDLQLIKTKVLKKNILLSYELIEFSNDGKLKSIAFSVDFGDGNKGSADNDNLSSKEDWGFFKNFNDDARVICGTGGIDL